MRITPANYNYANQNTQKNNNQPNFGMVLDAQTLEAYIKALNPKTRAYFSKQMSEYFQRIGELTHNGQEITARIVRETITRKKTYNFFQVEALSGGESRQSRKFEICECNGRIAAKRLYQALMGAGCQFQFRTTKLKVPQTPQEMTAKIIQGCKAHDSSKKM